MWDISDKINLVMEQENAPEQKKSKLNPLFKLAALEDPQGSRALEADLLNLSQATKDSLTSFVRGKGGVNNLLQSSDALAKLSAEINKSANEITHQAGIDYQISPADARKVKKLGGKLKKMPPEKQQELLGIDDIETGLEVEKESRKANHIGTYPLTGRTKLRVATEGESVNKHKLHVFKKGSKYIGYLVVSGPSRMKEDYESYISLILEAATNPTILKYESGNIKDMFNLVNYTKPADISIGQLAEYDDKAETVASHLASQLKMQTASLKDIRAAETEPTEKASSEESPEESPDINKDEINKISRAMAVARDHADNEYERAFYDRLHRILPDANAAQIKGLVDNMNKQLKKYTKVPKYAHDEKYKNHRSVLKTAIDWIGKAL